MQRTLILTAAIVLVTLALLPAPSAAARAVGTTGPYAGYVVEGQTNTHLYADPVPKHCILPVTYYVTLRYEPAEDVLGVSVGSLSDEGSDGFAQVVFEAACWTTFTIAVTGVDVGLVAAYTVTVSQGPPVT
jgi:hypothetical protein